MVVLKRAGWAAGILGLTLTALAARAALISFTSPGAAAPLPAAVAEGRFGDGLDASLSSAMTGVSLPAYKAVPLTVEIWCKLNKGCGFNIIAANEPKESSTHWEIYTAKDGSLCAYIPGVEPSVIGPSVVNHVFRDGKWHYVAMTVDEGAVALFVDGKEIGRKTVSIKSSGNVKEGPLTVGQTKTGSGGVDCSGIIDELRISSCVRKIPEKAPAAPFAADEQTVGLWHFDRGEDAGAFFADSSKTASHLIPSVPNGPSKNQLERAGYKAGPPPLASAAQPVSLQEGSCDLPEAVSSFSLDGEWQLIQSANPEENPDEAWDNAMPAQVPGSVHTALYRAGVIPDPYMGRNQEIVKEWSDKAYCYRKVFPRPPEGQDETLVFEGICNRCTIWLNGTKLGEHEGMFNSISYPVQELLQGTNTLVVKLDPAVRWGETVVFNNSYGWHYAKFPPLGIWRSVRIQGEPPVRMLSPFVATRDAVNGNMDLITAVTGASNWSGRIKGVITPDNFQGKTVCFEQDIKSSADTKNVHLKFQIPEPRLWWPVDMGAPNLYRLRLAFVPDGGGRPDVHDITFGIRTVQMEPVNGREHSNLYNWTFTINGRPMFVKGTGWCTPDAMMDFSRARYDRFLSLAASQHIQMLRAWGSGMVETEEFYDLCNRKGIMVMQEWPTAWNSHEKQPFEMLERTVREGTERLRNHPSLVLYAAGNESPYPYGTAIDMMGRLSIELDGTREFHRGEPAGGSAHDYTVYWAGKHIENSFRMASVFYGEFGVASYPCYESVLRFLPDEEKSVWPAPKDGSFTYHTPTFNKRDMQCLSHIAGYFTKGETMERFILGTQIGQAVGVRHALERMRTRWPASTGALYYKMNDNCPAASWSSVDWYGAPKIAHYLFQDSFSPLVAVVLYEKESSYGMPLTVPVFLLDDADALNGRPWEVRVRAYGADMNLIKEQRFAGQSSVDRVKRLGDFVLSGEQTKTNPLFMVMDVVRDGVLMQRNYNFTNFDAVKDCLFNLPGTRVEMAAEKDWVVLKNTGARPAVGVNISQPGHLDTFTAGDNYIWLDPGETQTIEVSTVNGLKLSGWNLSLEN